MEEDGGDRGRTAEEDGGGSGSPCTLGIEVRDDRPGAAGVRWRRAGKGGSFISLPHGIIYREDFRESTQRAPR